LDGFSYFESPRQLVTGLEVEGKRRPKDEREEAHYAGWRGGDAGYHDRNAGDTGHGYDA
jgi:hypothetical protein